MGKKNIYVSDADEPIFEKAKELFGESLAKLIANTLREKVEQQEALLAGMTEQTIYEGTEHTEAGIFQGQTFKFYGAQLSSGQHDGSDDNHLEVYLTKKGKFLVYRVTAKNRGCEQVCSYKVYDDFFQMRDQAQLPNSHMKRIEEYLSKNSTIRPHEVLDI